MFRDRRDPPTRIWEARFRALLDNAGVGIAVVTLDDHILEASSCLCEMLRLDPSALDQYSFINFKHPDDNGQERALFVELVDGTRERYSLDRRYVRRDGTTFLGHTTVTLIRDDLGQPDYIIGVIDDVTEARKNETALREASGLARVGQMAAIVAHEVRNPLAGIRAAVEIIGRALPKGSSERRIVGTIVERVSSLDELLTQLLLFARPPEPRFASLSLRALLERVRTILGEDLVVLDEGDAVINGDASLIEQAFTNLAINGLQASAGEEPVRVEVRPDEASCTIDFVDRGGGISDEVRARMYEPFFTTKSRGAGLGLANAKRAIEAHDGTIEVLESRPGSTTIRVTLPRGLSADP